MRNVSSEQLVGNRDESGPEPDEIEISVFGPGYGESVLFHVGGNNWFIVDSCIDPASGDPAPLSYLRKIKVIPTEAVKQIIATHWHDDHVRGLGLIVKECQSADFVCSEALKSLEFLTLVQAYGIHPPMAKSGSGVQEFQEILRILMERSSKSATPKLAIADRCLWQSEGGNNNLAYHCAIYSLSPSDASIIMAKTQIADLLPSERSAKKRAVSFTPNHAAVALLVKIGDMTALFGSDLEETGHPGTGWSAIINSRTRPQTKASIYKIAHHGSSSADQPNIWSNLLEEEPISVLSPFIKGDVSLPTKNDVNRICNKTSYAYATSSGAPRKTKRRDQVVEKQIREMGIKLRPLQPSPGQVRIRGKRQSDTFSWKVTLFGEATPLANLYLL